MAPIYKPKDLPEDFPFAIKFAEMPPYYCMDHTFHWHNYLEISYVKQGRGRYYIENNTYDLAPGDLVVINNIEPHYMEVLPPEPMIQPVIMFDSRLICEGSNSLFDKQYLEPFFARGSNFSNKIDRSSRTGQQIFTLLQEIETEYQNQAYGYQLMIKSKLLSIFTCLIRFYQDDTKSSLSPVQKNRRLAQLQVVFDYIRENLSQPLVLEELAALVYMSPSYFCTFFRRATGQTPVEYIHKVRVARAIDLLQSTDTSICEIAGACGFNNLAHFNRIFRRVTGQTPGAVRG